MVLVQTRDKIHNPIYYASKSLKESHKNDTVTKQKLIPIVFAFEKFCSYLLVTRVIVHINHFALRYFMTKNDVNRG